MVNFNHAGKSISESLCITNERADYLRGVMFYEMMQKELMIRTLYDNVEDAPSNMTTRSGILEAVFEDCDNEAERIFVTWDSALHEAHTRMDETHELAMKAGMFMLFMMTNKDKEAFIKAFVKHKNEALENRKNKGGDDDE